MSRTTSNVDGRVERVDFLRPSIDVKIKLDGKEIELKGNRCEKNVGTFRNILFLHRFSLIIPLLKNYSCSFLFKCLNYSQKIIANILSFQGERRLERKARERLFLDVRKWDIKLNSPNTMCFNEINFYQLQPEN